MNSAKTGQNPARVAGLQPKNRTARSPAMAKTAVIVPCRLESTRFPRKLLHPIRGRPLLLWVAQRIAQQAPEIPLWFAVDDPLLRDCLIPAGFQVLMTSSAHQSGTDRIA